jgi:hypothetical protein
LLQVRREAWLDTAHCAHVGLRPGPRRASPRCTRRSSSTPSRGEAITIPNPDERGDWLYVKDAVKAILALWDARDLTQRVFNIAGGVHSIREVVEIATRIRRRPASLASGASLSPSGGLRRQRRARQLGFRPDYTIEAAVASICGSSHRIEQAGTPNAGSAAGLRRYAHARRAARFRRRGASWQTYTTRPRWMRWRRREGARQPLDAAVASWRPGKKS